MLEAWEQESYQHCLSTYFREKITGSYTPFQPHLMVSVASNIGVMMPPLVTGYLNNLTNAVIDSLSQYESDLFKRCKLAILPKEALDKLVTVLTTCKAQGCKIAFDNNYRPALWETPHQAQQAYQAMLELTDIAFLTYDDEEMLYGDTTEQQAIDRTQALGVNEIVIKRGAEACFVITKDERIEVAPQKVDNIVDTTAAGDSFSAGYLAKRLVGGTLQESAKMGHTLAGTVICFPGAIIPSDKMPALN